MNFQGKGPTGTKLARFFNKCLTRPLTQYVRSTHGVEVHSHANGGLTISSSAGLFHVFKLTAGKHEITSGYVIGKLAAPGAQPESAALEHQIRFTYAPGWYAEDQFVVCMEVMGQWEVMSPAAGDHLEGTLEGALTPGGDTDVLITTSGGVYAGTVSSHNSYDLIGDEDDVVGIEWNPNRQQFVITAIKCPVAPDDDDADGGSASDGTGSGDEDGGTPDAAAGNLDGGSP